VVATGITADTAADAAAETAVVWPLGVIWRDIARGAFTENAAEIGRITSGGTIAVIIIGLGVGAGVGVLWVVVRTWLPGTGIRRALVARVVACFIGWAGSLIVADAVTLALGMPWSETPVGWSMTHAVAGLVVGLVWGGATAAAGLPAMLQRG